ILVLSNMGEMGESAEKYHCLVGQCIKQSSIKHIFLFGDESLIQFIKEEAGEKAQTYQKKSMLIAEVKRLLSVIDSDTLMLVKGSNANKMGEVIKACFPKL
ncbi:hypothetical protein OAO18_08365, partial [Francisellaceae bacterium]|nr:hypothetical protein [Francisellaceae bacterium]